MTLWDTEVKGIGNLVHNGIILMREYDDRWDFDEEEGEYLVAWIFTMDSVLVGLPGVPYDVVMNAEQFPNGEVSEACQKELNEYQNRVVPTLKKYKKIPMDWYLLKIKPPKGYTGVQLSVREIYINDEDPNNDVTLELKSYPVESDHKVVGHCIKAMAQWTVVCKDTGSLDQQRKRGTPQTAPKKSKAAQNAEKYKNVYTKWRGTKMEED